MLNRRPLIEVTEGEAPNGKTAECTTPGPSTPTVHPVLPPVVVPLLIQCDSSSSDMVKLFVRVFGVIVKAVGLRTVGSTETYISQALNGSMLETLTA